MTRQLLSLLCLVSAASLAVGYAAMPHKTMIAELANYVAPADLIQVASRGSVRTYLVLQMEHFRSLAPWFLIGAMVAAVARTGLWLWNRPPEVHKKMTLRDEAGGTVEMYEGSLNHDPGIRFIQIAACEGSLDSASAFENEMFSFIVGAQGLPANLEGDPNLLLVDHVRSAHQHILKQYPAGTIATALVIAYQTGKVLSAQKDGGRWVKVTDKFGQQAQIAVRRMRGYYRIAPPVRAQLMRCLSVLATNWIPVDLPDEERDLIRAIRIADMTPGAKQAVTTDAPDKGIDVRGIAASVSTAIVSIFSEFNVNQKRSSSDALDALFIKKDAVLLVPPKQMREAFEKLLPEEIASALQLAMPSSARHPSDEILKRVLIATGVLVTVYRDVRCDSGVYSVRSGRRRWASMWALSTKNTKQEIVDSWSDWSFEVEILESGEIHVG